MGFSKLLETQRISSKFPSQLEFGGEHLFGGIARGMFFVNISYIIQWIELINKINNI